MSLQIKILSKLFTIFLILFLSSAFGCTEDIEFDDENRYLNKAKELYEKAKESGEKVPEDIKEWIEEDIKKNCI